ncbi:MAG: NAD(+)/NADH kinase [Minisyncoccota bacterium]
MKVILFGRNLEVIKPLVVGSGFKIVRSKPDFVISYGGDGTLMQSEHEFPGIPKIILKGSLICKKASQFSNEEVLKKIKDKKFEIRKYFKLEAEADHKKLLASTDIVVHNKNPRHAIRYKVWVDKKEIGMGVIGDGVVIATPFGSTAYYRSITDSFFELGIGLAFNNSTEQADHMVLKEDSRIKIKIVRGPAVVYGDNQEGHIDLSIDGEIVIRKSKKIMRVIHLI